MLPDAARVYVRAVAGEHATQDAPAAQPSIEERDGLVVLRFPHARARANDLRPLDTSFFPGAVARVTPRRDGDAYALEIALRERVVWQQRVDGDLLAIDFSLPEAP
jgi:hypothetical protein